jgi:hypothetical protein
MEGITDPAEYDAGYLTGKGQWVGDAEFCLLMKLIQPIANPSLLDVGWHLMHGKRVRLD